MIDPRVMLSRPIPTPGRDSIPRRRAQQPRVVYPPFSPDVGVGQDVEHDRWYDDPTENTRNYDVVSAMGNPLAAQYGGDPEAASLPQTYGPTGGTSNPYADFEDIDTGAEGRFHEDPYFKEAKVRESTPIRGWLNDVTPRAEYGKEWGGFDPGGVFARQNTDAWKARLNFWGELKGRTSDPNQQNMSLQGETEPYDYWPRSQREEPQDMPAGGYTSYGGADQPPKREYRALTDLADVRGIRPARYSPDEYSNPEDFQPMRGVNWLPWVAGHLAGNPEQQNINYEDRGDFEGRNRAYEAWPAMINEGEPSGTYAPSGGYTSPVQHLPWGLGPIDDVRALQRGQRSPMGPGGYRNLMGLPEPQPDQVNSSQPTSPYGGQTYTSPGTPQGAPQYESPGQPQGAPHYESPARPQSSPFYFIPAVERSAEGALQRFAPSAAGVGMLPQFLIEEYRRLMNPGGVGVGEGVEGSPDFFPLPNSQDALQDMAVTGVGQADDEWEQGAGGLRTGQRDEWPWEAGGPEWEPSSQVPGMTRYYSGEPPDWDQEEQELGPEQVRDYYGRDDYRFDTPNVSAAGDMGLPQPQPDVVTRDDWRWDWNPIFVDEQGTPSAQWQPLLDILREGSQQYAQGGSVNVPPVSRVDYDTEPSRAGAYTRNGWMLAPGGKNGEGQWISDGTPPRIGINPRMLGGDAEFSADMFSRTLAHEVGHARYEHGPRHDALIRQLLLGNPGVRDRILAEIQRLEQAGYLSNEDR